MTHQSKPNISFLDKSFQQDLTKFYTLSILIGINEVALSVYQDDRNKYLCFYSYYDNENSGNKSVLNQVVSEQPWITQAFKNVFVIFANSANTLVPEALFDKTKKDLYLKFNQPIDEDSLINYDSLKHIIAANIYALPKELFLAAKELWPEAHFNHSSTILIESLIVNFKNLMNDQIVYVNVSDDSFELVNFKSGKLNFQNHFKYKTKEDFIYFLLAALDNLKLNPEEVEIVLIGEIGKEDSSHKMITKYIRNSRFIENSETFSYSYAFDQIDHHQYYILLNAILCG